MEPITIAPATPAHAPHIARAIMMAVGEEICADFAAPSHTLADVEALFTHLASLPDSQYSYLNSLVALTPTGEVAGVTVGYDGAQLHTLRRRFFEAAAAMLGRDMEGMADETSPDEFYIDTLAVFPPYRRQGIARQLLAAQAERAAAMGKPAGLLVDFTNPNAEALYTSVGFRPEGTRPFAGVEMCHMVKHPK